MRIKVDYYHDLPKNEKTTTTFIGDVLLWSQGIHKEPEGNIYAVPTVTIKLTENVDEYGDIKVLKLQTTFGFCDITEVKEEEA